MLDSGVRVMETRSTVTMPSPQPLEIFSGTLEQAIVSTIQQGMSGLGRRVRELDYLYEMEVVLEVFILMRLEMMFVVLVMI